jgi:pseudouridine-5'-phosphate glycosidase
MVDYVEIHPVVLEALKEGRPVVALESTIIAHGMPYPQNLETAKRIEDIVRKKGCVPATVAVYNGKIQVGLDDELLEKLATEPAQKISRRDLPVALASGELGATTVSATLIGAHKAGIRVFVTGGIGGVHRGAEKTFDISSDLEELAMSDVAVVSAGVKSILDLEKTLEVLETKGVPVLGFQTDELPAFYTRTSGLKIQKRVESAAEVADIMRAKWSLGLRGSILVANPIPTEDEADSVSITAAITAALSEADTQGIYGKAVTPFVLSQVAEVTGNASLKSNIALVENNARLGADIAKAYASEI